MEKKILFITCHKLSENNGGANASKGFIYAFAKLFKDCSLIFPIFDNPENIIPSSYKLYPCQDLRTKIQKGLDMYRGVVSALCGFVKNHLERNSYDLIVIDHSVTSTGLHHKLKKSGAKIITIHHNVERDYLKDNGNERPITYRFPYNFFAKRSEKKSLMISSVNLTLTEDDANTFRKWFPLKDIHVHCLGICEYRDIPEKTFLYKHSKQRFIITGSLCFIQSLKPILNFLEKYYSILKEECPNCELVIAGSNPAESLKEFCKGKSNIHLIPNPDNMEELTKNADYYICPINAGSGIKLRVLDGLKQGLPILCHEKSANGYELFIENNSLFPYNDLNSFRSSLRKMLDTSFSQDVIYNIYQKQLSLQAIIERLSKILLSEKIL